MLCQRELPADRGAGQMSRLNEGAPVAVKVLRPGLLSHSCCPEPTTAELPSCTARPPPATTSGSLATPRTAIRGKFSETARNQRRLSGRLIETAACLPSQSTCSGPGQRHPSGATSLRRDTHCARRLLGRSGVGPVREADRRAQHGVASTIYAAADPFAPVGVPDGHRVEVRGSIDGGTRAVSVNFTPAQAVAVGTAMIACAALAAQGTGQRLAEILPPLPPAPPVGRT